MKPRDIADKELKQAGYTKIIHGAKHDRYKNPATNKAIPLKRHDFNENDLRYIRKEIKGNEDGR